MVDGVALLLLYWHCLGIIVVLKIKVVGNQMISRWY